MENYDIRELAEKMMQFFFQIGHWKTVYYDKKFNVNGKGNNCGMLTARQYSILFLVYKFGINNISQMRDTLEISKSSLSITISRLVNEGYLEKCQPEGSQDGRKVHLQITAKGKEKIDEMYENMISVFVAFFSTLDSSQRKDVADAIEKLSHIL